VPTTIYQEQCQAILASAAKKKSSGEGPDAAVQLGVTAANLQAAYDLSSEVGTDGAGTTVAIVDAYQDPNIVSDLASYRAETSGGETALPACDATTGAGCVTVYNQTGQTGTDALENVPVDTTGAWEFEQAIDVDMVSAICPLCHIALFEANSDSLTNMGTAEDTAAGMFKYLSNSWENPGDPPGDSQYDAYFNHPGDVIDFGAGDMGYGTDYPGSSQFVTAVGGTNLTDTNGTWTQSVWNATPVSSGLLDATASGCASGESKPAWQTDTACPNRTGNDVAAAADSSDDGIGIYDSYNPTASGSDNLSCGGACSAEGTSVSTPIVTAVYALAIGGTTAGTPTPRTYPAQYPYMNDGTGLTRVTTGSDTVDYKGTNYTCESNREYLCNAADSLPDGYNGPTGWGTPNGANLSAFTDTATGDTISVANPGTQDGEAGDGLAVTVNIQAIDSDSAETLTYSASGLPSGLTINSSNGEISGTLNATPGTSAVTVTVSDGTGASTTVRFDIVATASLNANLHATTGAVPLALGGKCMDDANNSSANGNKVQIWGCTGSVNQEWTYLPAPNPGGAGWLEHNGECLAVKSAGTANGSKVELYNCIPKALNQRWYITGNGELFNWGSGTCLDDPSSSTTNGTQLDISTCTPTSTNEAANNQAWTLPAGPIQSGISGMCASDRNGSNVNGTYIWLWSCGGQSSQNWTLSRTGTLLIEGKCLSVGGRGTTNGSQTVLWSCGGTSDQYWFITGTGEIQNVASEKCLAASGTGNGARLELEDCTGATNEIWAQS
jgi:hypothetical protein